MDEKNRLVKFPESHSGIARLLQRTSPMAAGLPVGGRDLQLAAITLLWLVGLNIDWDCLVLQWIVGSHDKWGFPPFWKTSDSPLAQP